jgi:hypothetical protein
MWDNPKKEFDAARKRSEEVRMLTYATYAGAYEDECYVSKRLRARGARRLLGLVI